MSATTENTQLMNLFTNFLKDASKLVKVKKDTDCLLSQIIAHMATDECNTTAIQNLERIFQRPFGSSQSDSSTTEEPLTIDTVNAPTSPLKQKKIRAKKSELNSPVITDKDAPKVTKGKPGRKAKTQLVEEEPVLELVAPVVASACATPVLEEPKPTKAKKAKAKKTKEPAPTEEAPSQEMPKEEQPKEEQPKEEQPKEEQPKEEEPKEEEPKEEEPPKKEKKIKKVKAKKDKPKEEEPKEDPPSEDLVAKLVAISNTEELTEEDLLELLSEDEE